MDLTRFNPIEDKIREAKKLLGYQPFILSNSIQTGHGYAALYGEGLPWVMEKDDISKEDWEAFVEANARLRRMYDDWIDTTHAIVGNLSKLSVVDTGCNTGYFLYRFWGKGARKCVGYDRSNMGAAINVLNNITGSKVKFVHKPYNPLSHKIKGCGRYDIVISSAVMCHLSDPLYYLSFLASIIRKALLLHTRISEEDNYLISYGKVNRYYKEDHFPVNFDNEVTMSQGLLYESLRLSGFTEIREIEYSNEWLSYDWYHRHKTVVALKRASSDSKVRTWNVAYGRREWLAGMVYRLFGSRLYYSLVSWVKSKPRLESIINKVISIHLKR
ncbi:class I SAM-dependent methyltransferase [Chloroflexota bacterium]